MSKETGSVFGGTLLIAGSCLGAGMLGMPIVTGLSGFSPSIAMLLVAWAFMTVSAFLLVEVNGWFSHQVNLLTMVEKTLGKWGKAVCWATYLFLFYAILVAYISGIGGLSSSVFHSVFHLKLPPWVGSLFFVLLFGWMIGLGTYRVDLCNRVLMIGKIGFFILLVLIGVPYIQPSLLTRTAPIYAPFSLPLLVIAFGFQNMIPSLTAYLKGDLKRVRITIIAGSLLSLGVYIIWEVLVLGIVPFGGMDGLVANLKQDREAAQAIAVFIDSPLAQLSAQGMAFFIFLTSFLAQSLGLVHFLADGLKISYKRREHLGLCALALLPPLLLAIIYPQLFFKALNFAGGICTMILFGLLPVCMVWVGRYRRQMQLSYEVFGGKATLAGVLLVAVCILFLQISSMTGMSFVPSP